MVKSYAALVTIDRNGLTDIYPKLILLVERGYFRNSKSSDEFQHQAVYDLLFEVCAIFMYSLPHLSKTYTVRITVLCLARASHTSNFQSSLFPFLVPYLLGLIHIALMGSIYTTIAGGLFKILSSLFFFLLLVMLLCSTMILNKIQTT